MVAARPLPGTPQLVTGMQGIHGIYLLDHSGATVDIMYIIQFEMEIVRQSEMDG